MSSNASIHTVIIDTLNMAVMAKFYQQGFGWEEPTTTEPDHLGWQLPNLYFGFDLITNKNNECPGSIAIWFDVDTLQETFDHFVSLGGRVCDEPALQEWGATTAAVFDPDGNVIGLTQRV